jgi:hypothetical protein
MISTFSKPTLQSHNALFSLSLFRSTQAFILWNQWIQRICKKKQKHSCIRFKETVTPLPPVPSFWKCLVDIPLDFSLQICVLIEIVELVTIKSMTDNRSTYFENKQLIQIQTPIQGTMLLHKIVMQASFPSIIMNLCYSQCLLDLWKTGILPQHYSVTTQKTTWILTEPQISH